MAKRPRGTRESRVATRESGPEIKAAPLLATRDLRLPIAAALFLAVLATYGQVLHHEFNNFDDPDYVTENEHVSTGLSGANVAWAFTHFHSSNWHPLTWISHMVDVQLFGLDAGKHALVSVLLHALNTVLLFFVLRRATERLWPSAAVAALFALHPLHVESVAWISERKDVLSTLFFLAAIWFYIGWARHRSRLEYALTIVCYALGLMAKPMVITLPFVLLLLDFWPLKRKPAIVEKLPLFALIIPSAILTTRAQTEAMTPLPTLFRLANAALSYVAYLGKMLWPSSLAVFYPYRATIAPSLAFLAVLILLAITAIVMFSYKKRPYFAVGWLWYLGTLVPVIGVIQVGQQSMADRYTYIPLIGIFIAVAWAIADLRLPRNAVIAVSAIVLVALAGSTFAQVRTWQDSITLFSHAISVTKNNRVAHTNLGTALLKKLDYASAANELRTSIAINDNDELAHNGLGVALNATGESEAASRELRKAIAINPNKPEPYRNLGRIALAAGRNDEARKLFEKAQSIKPDLPTSAALAVARGDIDGAIPRYLQAIAQTPDAADLHNDLAAMLAKKGRDEEALVEYQKAIQLAPHQYDARMNLAALLTRFNRQPEAVEQIEAAAKERPKATEPHVYLALTYTQMGRTADAIREIEQALAIDPASADAEIARATHQNVTAGQFLAYLRKKR